VSHCIAEGDWVSARVVFSAIHSGPGLGPPPSHKPVSLTALVLVRFENGQVIEGYNELNQLSLMQQIT
jgi:predicted ester cyclase